jgi:hypothetical protein
MPPIGRPYHYEGTRVNLAECWRGHCREPVDIRDDLGLCPLHIAEMRDPEYVRDLTSLYETDAPEMRSIPDVYTQRPIND